jgi:hypothetical protein
LQTYALFVTVPSFLLSSLLGWIGMKKGSKNSPLNSISFQLQLTTKAVIALTGLFGGLMTLMLKHFLF